MYRMQEKNWKKHFNVSIVITKRSFFLPLHLVNKYSSNFLLIKKIHSLSSNRPTSLYPQQCTIETLIQFDPTGRGKQTWALFRSERHHPSHFSVASSMASIWERNVSCAGRLVKGRWVNRLFLAVTYSLYRICTDGEIRVRRIGHVWLTPALPFEFSWRTGKREHESPFLLILFGHFFFQTNIRARECNWKTRAFKKMSCLFPFFLLHISLFFFSYFFLFLFTIFKHLLIRYFS